jgi:hypothetical protein
MASLSFGSFSFYFLAFFFFFHLLCTCIWA